MNEMLVLRGMMRALGVAILIVSLAACGNMYVPLLNASGNGTTAQGSGSAPASTSSGATSSAMLTFSSVSSALVSAQCMACHQAGGAASEYDFSSYASMMASGVVMAGKPDSSSLYLSVSGSAQVAQMPPGASGSVASSMVEDIQTWISQGANP